MALGICHQALGLCKKSNDQCQMTNDKSLPLQLQKQCVNEPVRANK